MNRDAVASLHEQLEQATTRAEAAEAELAEARKVIADTDESLRHLCRMAEGSAVLCGSLRGFGLWRDMPAAAQGGA